MAKKRTRGAGTVRQAASGGEPNTRRHTRNGRRRKSGRAAGAGRAETRAQLSLGMERPGPTRRFLGEARDMARSVGETTVGAARGLASGVRDVAGGVARGTQGAAGQVVGKVRENPWPALLIGAGATWMVIDATRGHGEDDAPRRGRRRQGGAGHYVKQAVSTVADAGRGAGGHLQQFARDNPLLAGAATLGIGMAVGMAIPESAKEAEVFGNAGRAIARKAKDAVRGTMDTMRGAADDRIRRSARS